MSFTLIAMAILAPPSPYQMTAAEVQACGAQVTERNRRIAEVKDGDVALLAEQDALTKRQADLTAMAGTVDKKKKKDVEAYNAASAAFNAAIAAHHAKVEARNQANAALPALDTAYNASCSHRTMNPADVAALPADQRAAMTAGARTTTIMVPTEPKPARRRR